MTRPAGGDGHGRGTRILLLAVVVAVAAVVSTALVVLDSPFHERRERLDAERSRGLHELVRAVEQHWKEEGALPADRAALEAWADPQNLPTDPATGEPYAYRATAERRYELCATFATQQDGSHRRREWTQHGELWHHPAGERCYELRVAPDG